MDRDRALQLQRNSLRDYVGMVAHGSPAAFVIELEGVLAAVSPATPGRSIPNSVTYDNAGALADAHAELAARYERAGIEAWTVWVPEFDDEAIELLERAGHRFDGHPAAMTLQLGDFEPPDLGELDWDSRCDGETLGRVNDRAYGHDAGDGHAGALAALRPGGALRLYRALDAGTAVSALGTIDHAEADGTTDCGIYFVATDPDRRRRGLSTRLLGAALIEARDRGCATSTLQGSAQGRPIYERLGYERLFDLNLYELRRD
ncbi:MAG: GNAT family N-acetyltransferase [Solirubrobacterales bacterium]